MNVIEDDSHIPTQSQASTNFIYIKFFTKHLQMYPPLKQLNKLFGVDMGHINLPAFVSFVVLLSIPEHLRRLHPKLSGPEGKQ